MSLDTSSAQIGSYGRLIGVAREVGAHFGDRPGSAHLRSAHSHRRTCFRYAR
jgi:hypothetical protein